MSCTSTLHFVGISLRVFGRYTYAYTYTYTYTSTCANIHILHVHVYIYIYIFIYLFIYLLYLFIYIVMPPTVGAGCHEFRPQPPRVGCGTLGL